MVVKVVLYKLKFSTTNFSLQKMEDSDHCTVTLSPSLPVADDSLNPVVRLQRLDVQRYLSSGLVLLFEMYLSLAPFTALNSNNIYSCLCHIIVDMLILYIIVVTVIIIIIVVVVVVAQPAKVIRCVTPVL